MNYMTRYDMNSNQKLERSKQAVPLRRTTTPLPEDSYSSYGGLMRSLLLTLLFLLTGVTGVWGQTPKVADGIYYIQNNNSVTHGYLWPSLTTNTTTGYRYLTTSLETTATAVTNNNGVSYPAHDKSYSHWVVKMLLEGTSN